MGTQPSGSVCCFYLNNWTKPNCNRRNSISIWPNTYSAWYVSYFDVMQHANAKISNLYMICTLILM